MTLSSDDTRYIRGSGIILVVCLIIGAATAYFGHYRWQSAEKKHRTAISQNQEMRQKLAQASNEQVELTEKISRFLSLKQQGIIGVERRLDWVEQLALIRRERKLSDMRYELSAQHPVDKSLLPSGANSGGHEFSTSTLQFTSSLLHEDDLLTLLHEIRTRLSALPIVQTCTLARRPADTQTANLNYTLKAECEIELITLKEPGS